MAKPRPRSRRFRAGSLTVHLTPCGSNTLCVPPSCSEMTLCDVPGAAPATLALFTIRNKRELAEIRTLVHQVRAQGLKVGVHIFTPPKMFKEIEQGIRGA